MSKPKTNKTKKPEAPKAKAPPKKAKPVGNSKPPEEQSAPMEAGLTAVADMPKSKTSKLNLVTELLLRPEGATVDDMIGVTGWQKHTVRAALSHALGKKRGYKIVSEKLQGGKRFYKIAKIADPAKGDH